jgi:hypothetical protein
MDLATAELERELAAESADWRERARDEARRMREDALAACRDQTMTRESYRCTMAAKTYEELIRCPGWR